CGTYCRGRCGPPNSRLKKFSFWAPAGAGRLVATTARATSAKGERWKAMRKQLHGARVGVSPILRAGVRKVPGHGRRGVLTEKLVAEGKQRGNVPLRICR